MRRRKVYFLAVLVATVLLILSGVAMPAPAKRDGDAFLFHRGGPRDSPMGSGIRTSPTG
jgi:hypothetical protein